MQTKISSNKTYEKKSYYLTKELRNKKGSFKYFTSS